MNSQPNPEIIAQSPIGAELDPKDCRTLAGIMTARRLADTEILIEEGRTDDSLYLIVQGAVAVTRNAGGGNWTVLHVLRPGDIAGEMGFLDGKEHSATLRAMGETEIYSLQRQALESLVDKHPMLLYRVMRGIVRSVHRILRRMNFEYVELTNYITKQHGRY